jgi:hypothetical protein
MPLIPLSAILAVVSLLAELLKTFNSLPEPIRTRIVNNVLDDKDKREELWGKFTGWLKGLFERVDRNK